MIQFRSKGLLYLVLFYFVRKDLYHAAKAWEINRTGEIVVGFNKADSTEEMNFFLQISAPHVDELAPLSVHPYDDCRGTDISSNKVVASADKENAVIMTESPGYKKVEVDVDIKTENLVHDDGVFAFKEGSNNEIAFVSFCVAADLGSIIMYNGTEEIMSSISYLHITFNITINLVQGFEVAYVNIEEKGPEDIDENAQVSYNLESCECNPNNRVCLDVNALGAYNQNSELHLCVYIPENIDDIQIKGIKEMELVQENTGLALRAIENYDPNSITSVSTGNEKRMIVSTRLVSAFFYDTVSQVTVSGIATIEFISGRKLIASRERHSRKVQEEGDGEGSFELEILLYPGQNGSGKHEYDTYIPTYMLVVFGFIFCVI